MKDLFDLGNLVFDELIKSHGEQESGRELFLYTLTLSQPFYLLGSTKIITVSGSGISKNFEDLNIDSINRKWQSQVSSHKEKIADEILKQVKQPQRQPKDGDIFNMWGNDDEWREIKL